MPSETGRQHRFMAMNCKSAKARKRTGMSKKVACDFMHADKGKHFKESDENVDIISMDIPFLIRILEHAREDLKSDNELHKFVEKIIDCTESNDVLTMDCFEKVVPADKMKEDNLDIHSRWVLDGGMNTTYEQKFAKNMNRLAEKAISEVGDPFASWQGVDLQRKHWNKDSMKIIDGAIRVTSNAKTAEERIAALHRYADEVGVPYSVLYNEILQNTGDGYFDKDDYTKDTQFQRPTRESAIIDSYKKLIKKA